jgi:hypothetical protein
MTRVLTILACLTLTSCTGTAPPSDITQLHLDACETYTSALETTLVWVHLGKLDANQLALLQRIEQDTTPLCQGAQPSENVVELINHAADQLEAIVTEIVLEETT